LGCPGLLCHTSWYLFTPEDFRYDNQELNEEEEVEVVDLTVPNRPHWPPSEVLDREFAESITHSYQQLSSQHKRRRVEVVNVEKEGEKEV